ncbi:hypothetical protein [Acidisphaera sp. S103]|uniref:hypothetical protein n=1 Tax=Acidisphaera sp. S103 TaxID=1747223 RepID=UPI00131AF0C3|nr:hypothetical protein [Acidisphaera sp. S103]
MIAWQKAKDGATAKRKPEMSTYHPIVDAGDPSGIDKRTSIEAANTDEAKVLLEEKFGRGAVVSLWGEWEAQQARAKISAEK